MNSFDGFYRDWTVASDTSNFTVFSVLHMLVFDTETNDSCRRVIANKNLFLFVDDVFAVGWNIDYEHVPVQMLVRVQSENERVRAHLPFAA
jgi:hypothetical protein